MGDRSDFYVYVMFRHDTGGPFYVGKGRGKRIKMTKWRRENAHKRNIILMAEAAKCEIPIVRVATGLTEHQAFEVEMALIAAIGRWPNGPLVNCTDGGEGSVGYIASDETRAKLSAKLRGRSLSAEHRTKIGEANKRRIWTSEARANRGKASRNRADAISAKNKERIWTDSAKAKIGDAARGNRYWVGRSHSEETKTKIGIASKGRMRVRNSAGQFEGGIRC